MTSHRLSALFAGTLLCLSAGAADRGAAAAAREEYQRERAACMPLQDPDARKTCLREAGAALIEMRRGTLATGGDFEANRFARCAVHADPLERSLCERRMRGEGTVSGSVEGGGILRELTITVPAEDASTGK